MSYREEEIALQTTIRKRMLANGYSPVPNYDKRCFMPGRNEAVITEAMIDHWSGQVKHLSTGVRVDWPMVAIDIDIDDVEAIEAVVNALPQDLWDKVKHAPVRRSSSRTKEAWFVRLDEGEAPFARLTSASFYRADDPAGEDGTTHRIEVFGSESGQQMGVFGAHTRDDIDVAVVLKDYVWDGPSLLDVAIWDLPTLTRAEVAVIADTATAVLTERGWKRKMRSKDGFSSPQTIYDLTDDTVFETHDHGDLSLDELIDAASESRGVRLSASFHSPGSHNTSRCIASIGGDGVLRVIDFETANTHRLASDAPKPLTQGALERLQELSAASGSVFAAGGAGGAGASAAAPTAAQDVPVGVAMADEMEAVVEALLHDVAFWPAAQRAVTPIDGGPDRAMSMGNFKLLMQPWAVEVRGPRGGAQQINPASLWAADPRRVVVGGYRFRPDLSGQRLVTEDGMQYINTYRPLPDNAVDGVTQSAAAAAFEALLSHLVPDQGERDWFRMWLASKVQRPQAANCGVLMIADQQGTGRGTLFDMMRVAVGRPYYRSITSIELLGSGGQGAYTGWAAQSLLVTVEEVMAGADSGSTMGWKRREAYERIKQLVDPRQRAMEIREKGIPNYTQEVFFSLLMATNHMDALPLDRNDRRIAVIIQPDVRFEDMPRLKALVDPWRKEGSFSDAFGYGLRQHLMTVAVDFAALRIAPELNGGREVMREANEGDLEDILRTVLHRVPGDFMLNRDLKRRMQNAVTAEGEGDHLKNWWVRVQDMLKRANTFGWRAMQTRQAYLGADGSVQKGVIYYREAGGVEAWKEASMSVRSAELLAPAADVNRVLTAAAEALRDGRLTVVSDDAGRGQ